MVNSSKTKKTKFYSIFFRLILLQVESLPPGCTMKTKTKKLLETNDEHSCDEKFVLSPALYSSCSMSFRLSSLVAEKIPRDDLEFRVRVSSAVLGLENTFEPSPRCLFGYCSSIFIFQANIVSTIPGFDIENVNSLVCNKISQLSST